MYPKIRWELRKALEYIYKSVERPELHYDAVKKARAPESQVAGAAGGAARVQDHPREGGPRAPAPGGGAQRRARRAGGERERRAGEAAQSILKAKLWNAKS